MKQIVSLLLLGILHVLFSSWAVPANPTVEKRFPIETPKIKSGTDAWNFHKTEYINNIVFSSCTGEMIQNNITIEWLNTGVENKNGYVSVWNYRIYGTSVGLSSGNEYIIREHNNSTIRQSFVNGLLTFPLKDKWWMRSTGKGQDFSGGMEWMIVMNANGEEVPNTFDFWSDCP